MTDDPKNEVGYGKPPRSTRYRKGQSGNPRGRPKGKTKGVPYDAVLSQMVTIYEDGGPRRVTAAEAFLLRFAKKGLQGDAVAARRMLAAIEAAREKDLVGEGPEVLEHVIAFEDYRSVNAALEPLGMARMLDRKRPTARMVLEPWLVQEALGRLGDRRFTPEEQRVVLKATRTPRKVQWPEWWTELPEKARQRR